MNQIPIENLTEEDIQRELAGASVSGPKVFRGRPLATWKLGLRDLIWKVTGEHDPLETQCANGLYVLTEAYAESKEEAAAKREELIRRTDDRDSFRAQVSVWKDEWTPEDEASAVPLVIEIQRPSKIAEVVTISTEKKSEPEPLPEMTTQ